MKTTLSSRSKMFRRGVLAAVIASAMTAVAAEAPIKAPRDLDVVADKNPLSDTVETVPSQTDLQPLAHEGSWIKVRTPSGKEGYVSSDDIAPLASLSGSTGSTSVNGLSVAGASKGFKDDTEKYAKMKNFKTDSLNQMVAWGNDVSQKDVKDFAKGGHVGPAKYRNK
jgi:hypothetical protein